MEALEFSSYSEKALQEDIERHTNGITSVLNLCEVLLHDTDACPTPQDQRSLAGACKSLDRRWKSICSNSNLRRTKIEETQDEWKRFLVDFSKFKEWLEGAEKKAKQPNTQVVTYENAKIELHNYQSFQRQVQEGLTQLELINKQYRKLARENKTDTSEKLKKMVQDGNARWDALMKRCYNIIRRLKHAIGRRENFKQKREALGVWLTELDLQLTNLQHFSSNKMKDSEKIQKLKNFKDRLLEKVEQIRELDRTAGALVQCSEARDAQVIEDEMRDFHEYCCDVTSRLSKYNEKLFRSVGIHPSYDIEDEMRTFRWWRPPPSCLLRPPALAAPSGGSSSISRLTPASSGATSSLEWDTFENARNPTPKHDDVIIEHDESTLQLHEDDFLSVSPAGLAGSSRRSSSHQTNELSKRGSPISMTQLHSDASPFLNATKRRRQSSVTSRSRSPSPTKSAQLRDDVTTLNQWLDDVTNRSTRFDDVIDYRCVTIDDMTSFSRELQELEREMESRRPIVMSVNLMTTSRDTNSCDVINEKWNDLSNVLLMKREKLQQILIESIDFKENVEELDAFVDEMRHQIHTSSITSQSAVTSVPLLRKSRKSLNKLKTQTLEMTVKASDMNKVCNEIVRGGNNSDVTASTSSRLRSAAHGSAVDMARRLGKAEDKLKSVMAMVNHHLHQVELKLQEERQHARRGSDFSTTSADSLTSNDATSLHASPFKMKQVRRKEPEVLTCQQLDRDHQREDIVDIMTSQRRFVGTTDIAAKEPVYTQATPERQPAEVANPSRRRKSFLHRSLLAAVPFYILFFLLYVSMLFLEPEDAHMKCMMSNTLYAHWWPPVYQWVDGPPAM